MAFNEGIEQGKKQNSIEIAKNLLKIGLDSKVISENTGLLIEEVEKIKNDIEK